MLRAIPDWMFLTTRRRRLPRLSRPGHVADLHAPPSAFLGKSVAEVLPPPIGETLVQAFARASASDEPEKVEYVMGADDSERFFEACIVRCDGDKILSIVRDITDRKRAELDTDAQRRELAHLSRVATLGELTGRAGARIEPAAHRRAQQRAGGPASARPRSRWTTTELRAALDDIIRNNKRAGAVIDRLRALLRKESTALQPVDVNEVVRDVVDLAHSESRVAPHHA